MKKIKIFYRLIALAVVLVAALVVPEAASAKWSKACSDFSYDGVSVKVTDRHVFVGHPMDTYGYATYRNGTDEPVTVYWRAYGVLKKGGKLVMCNDDKFELWPGQEVKMVYSYDSGRFTHRDCREYVIAIEVKPLNAAGVIDLSDIDPTKVDYTAIRRRYRDGDKMTQEDYAKSVVWINWFFDNVFYPYQEKRKANLGDAHSLYVIEKEYDKYALDEYDQFALGNMLNKAMANGNLEAPIAKAWKAHMDKLNRYRKNYPGEIYTYNGYVLNYDYYKSE